MTTNTNAALISHLQALGDRAYCDYIAKMKTNECLGWEEKVRTKKFGQAELTAHTKAGELLGKHRAFAEAVAALTTAAAVPAEGVVMVPVELANRVQESLGEFLMDHGWSQRDMDTSDEFGAVLLAAAPKADPALAGEYPPLPEPYHVAYDDIDKEDVKCFAEGQLRAYVDTDRAMRAQAAPVAQGDALDAARYRMLRRGQHWSVINGVGDTLRAEELDAAIDAARSKAKEGGAA